MSVTESPSPRILLLETATEIFSVGLMEAGKIRAVFDFHTPRAHNRLITLTIQDLLARLELAPADLDGVALSGGPGSYTGLRVGAAAAKGICFALNLPLLAVPTLECLTAQFIELALQLGAEIVPMLDARRMEVYTAAYAPDLTPAAEPESLILSEETAARWRDGKPRIFAGNGVGKAADLLGALPGALLFPEASASAAAMTRPVNRRWARGEFCDLDAWEPDYLKSYAVNPPKKRL